MRKYYCPACGAELEQGQYEYNYDSGELHVVDCPDCNGSVGMVVHDCYDAARKYCEDNIEDFLLRYDLALSVENKMRCSLEHADPQLYSEIADRINEWSDEHDNDEPITPDDLF